MAEASDYRYASMPSTHWSLIDLVRRGDVLAARKALDQLLRRYLPALRAHLVGHRRLKEDAADDLLQGFISGEVLERQLFGKADQGRGKFRSLLLTALDRYVARDWRHRSAQKRVADRAVSFEDLPPGHDEPGGERSDEFDVAWARLVLDRALEGMRRECESGGRMDLWVLFEARVLEPIVDDAKAASYGALVEKLKLQSPRQASNALITAKRMFLRHLRDVVAEYSSDADEIEEEIRDLRAILAEAGAGMRRRT